MCILQAKSGNKNTYLIRFILHSRFYITGLLFIWQIALQKNNSRFETIIDGKSEVHFSEKSWFILVKVIQAIKFLYNRESLKLFL
jgi:hypothetical protein